MLKFKIRFDKFEFVESEFDLVMNIFIEQELRGAALAFFEAAIPILLQHVDTGMSIASMKNLAELLGQPLSYVPKPRKTPPKYLPPGTDPSQAIDKSPHNGELMATPIGKILGTNAINGRPQLVYYTEVWHFVLWDTVGLPRGRGGPTGAPWLSFDAGQKAALEYLRGSAKRVPDLQRLMAKTEYVVLAQTGITQTTVRKQKQITSRRR